MVSLIARRPLVDRSTTLRPPVAPDNTVPTVELDQGAGSGCAAGSLGSEGGSHGGRPGHPDRRSRAAEPATPPTPAATAATLGWHFAMLGGDAAGAAT